MTSSRQAEYFFLLTDFNADLMNVWFISILTRHWSLCSLTLCHLLLLPPENKTTLWFYREVMLFNLILLMLTTTSFMYWLSIYSGWSCGSWCTLMAVQRGHKWNHITASSMQHYSLNHASFTLPDLFLCPSSLTARGGLQWIIHPRLYHNIYSGIDASLLFSDLCLFVQSSALR